MPIFNGEPYLVDAVKSIQNQTLGDWELICVDDCSTDNTLEIIQKFAKKDKRIFIYKNNQKKYLSGSLNLALSKARGKYIARMDADDISLPNRFQRQVDLLEREKKLIAVGTDIALIDEQGVLLGTKYFPKSPEKCYAAIANYMSIQPPTLMARAEIMRRLKYNTGIAKHDDIDMHFQLLRFGGFSNVDDILFQYRKRPDSYTFSNAKKVFFMALCVRIRAIAKYNYRPRLSSLFILFCQVLIVSLLPSNAIIFLFEYLRLKRPLERLLAPVHALGIEIVK